MDLSTPQSVYFYRRSKYHAGVSMSLNPIRPSRLFGREEGGLKEEEQLQRDIEELSQERERLGGLLAGAKGELAALERQSAEVERQREEITGAYNREKRGRDDLQRKLAFRKNEVASLEAQGSQETEAERLLAQVPQVQEQQFAAAQRIHKALLGECRASLEMADLALALREVQALMGERAGRHRALREELISVQQQLQQQEARLERAQAQAQAARQEAMEVINPDEDDAVRELFDELPDNLEELEVSTCEGMGLAHARPLLQLCLLGEAVACMVPVVGSWLLCEMGSLLCGPCPGAPCKPKPCWLDASFGWWHHVTACRKR